jgi:hypothetical protein
MLCSEMSPRLLTPLTATNLLDPLDGLVEYQ